MNAIIRALPVGPLSANCYLLSLPGRSDCAIIDPGGDAARIREACEGRAIAAVLLTHGHIDHIAATDDVLPAGGTLYMHPLDIPMLTDTMRNLSSPFGITQAIRAQATAVTEGQTIHVAGIPLLVLHTPGHTPGSVCYQGEFGLLTGDTLFHGGIGRTDFPGGNPQTMERSLRRLLSLPDTRFYPGHNDSAWLSEER